MFHDIAKNRHILKSKNWLMKLMYGYTLQTSWPFLKTDITAATHTKQFKHRFNPVMTSGSYDI
jgi:hypothetical protein